MITSEPLIYNPERGQRLSNTKQCTHNAAATAALAEWKAGLCSLSITVCITVSCFGPSHLAAGMSQREDLSTRKYSAHRGRPVLGSHEPVKLYLLHGPG